mgnify:CR=1 FL=1
MGAQRVMAQRGGRAKGGERRGGAQGAARWDGGAHASERVSMEGGLVSTILKHEEAMLRCHKLSRRSSQERKSSPSAERASELM